MDEIKEQVIDPNVPGGGKRNPESDIGTAKDTPPPVQDDGGRRPAGPGADIVPDVPGPGVPPTIPVGMWRDLYRMANETWRAVDPRLASEDKTVESMASLTFDTFQSEPALRKIRPLFILATAIMIDGLSKTRTMIAIRRESLKKTARTEKPTDDLA